MSAINSTIVPYGQPGNVRKVTDTGRGTRSRQTLLSVSSLPADHIALSQILVETPWRIAAVSNYREARALLSRQPASVIVCERDLPDGTWLDILGLFVGDDKPPLVIVASRLADDRLWAEVLNLGGYDVLAKPFHELEVRHALTSAANHFERTKSASAPS